MRKHPLATSSRSILCAAIILILTCGMVSTLIAQRAPKVLGHTAYRSPDRTLVATVVSLEQLQSYGDNPSRVEIRRAGGHWLASRNHSDDIDQGFRVEKAAWTPDSRFFVYSLWNAGGHSSWHMPLFFYSRKRNRFYCLDAALGAMGHGDGAISGGFELRRPSTLLTWGRYYGKSRQELRTGTDPKNDFGAKSLVIDLRWLERRLTRADKHYN